LYINTCNLIRWCVNIHTGAPVYIETYAVSRVVGEKKNRRHEKTIAVRVLHIPGQGDVITFRSRSITACRFRIQTADVSAFLHNTSCAMALVSRYGSPKGLTSVGERLAGSCLAWSIS
jgi:hypothetical protein